MISQFAYFGESSEEQATQFTSNTVNNGTEETPSPKAFYFLHQPNKSRPVEEGHRLQLCTYKESDWRLTEEH